MLDIQNAESSEEEGSGDESKSKDEVEILKEKLKKAGLESAIEKRTGNQLIN
jgi:hypothetical protein